MTDDRLDFEVRRDDWATTRFVAGGAPDDLAPGQVRLRVDRFAITANNVSYALSGDGLGYWRFFPAGDEGWGRVPAMGFGDVVASRHPEVAEGTRCFGFYPMSRTLTIEPSSVGAGGIMDGAKHRAGLAPTYAQYAPVASDPAHRPEFEDAIILMRGLFLTSFLAEDFLDDAGLHGAESVLVTSASSKTAIALGFQVRKRGRARAVGLTSARNFGFVKGLGCYDDVVTYDAVDCLDAGAPAGIVDMAGDGELTATLHHHYRDQLKFDCAIGATHWEAPRSDAELPGARPEFFFAPSQIQKRSREWGPAEFRARLGEGWQSFAEWSQGWLRVEHATGREALERAWADTVAGRVPPSTGIVRSLWEPGASD